jgi:hypothetical protein
MFPWQGCKQGQWSINLLLTALVTVQGKKQLTQNVNAAQSQLNQLKNKVSAFKGEAMAIVQTPPHQTLSPIIKKLKAS